MNKLIYVLLDGVGDKPEPSLNYLTPLEAAYTPYLDSITRKGVSGIVYSVGKGISPESDIAVFCMLGYDLSSNYFGRGVVEAIGAGMDFKQGDLALRVNFATEQDGVIVDRRAGRDLTSDETKEFAVAINKIKLSSGATFKFIPTVSHRAVVKFRVDGIILNSEITNTDPAYKRVGGMGIVKETSGKLYLKTSTPLNDSVEAKLASDLVNEFTEKTRSILKSHKVNLDRERKSQKPANVLLLRDAGHVLPDIPKMSDRFGISFASILDMPVEKGVARISGMSDFSGGDSSDYKAKAKKALSLLKKYDCVYVHIKGPDEPGHDGDALKKKKVIELIDSDFFKILISNVDMGNTTFIVSADHSTPCSDKSHSDDPVPLVISGPNVKRDSVCRFTEKEAAKGSLGIMRGIDVLPKALTYLK
ncbi:MAG TPA: alkaline phosphatase family protein [Nitrososphaerales archaeon]